MINEKIRLRILMIGAILIASVVGALVFIVIPFVTADTTPQATPENAVPAFWVVAAIRLLIVAVIFWALLLSKRGSFINKEILVIAGILSIILGLVILDAATAYLGHHGIMPKIAILLFICVGFDIISGILVIIARSPRKQ